MDGGTILTPKSKSPCRNLGDQLRGPELRAKTARPQENTPVWYHWGLEISQNRESTLFNMQQQEAAPNTLYNAQNDPGPSADNKAGLKQKQVSKALCDESLSQ